MADNRVEIIIGAKGDGAVREIRRVEGEIGRLGSTGAGSMAGVEGSVSSLTVGLKSAMVAAQALGAALALGAAVSAAVEYNSAVESSRMGIAAVLSAQGQFVDNQNRQLEGAEKMNAAYSLSSDLMKQLEKDNLSTTATLEQLVGAFQETLSPGLTAGLDVDQIRQYTVAMVQAAGAMKLPMDKLGEETRSMLTGNIDPQNTQIASRLGVTNEDVERYKGNAQGLFDFLMGKLKAFSEFGVESQTTYAGLLSNLKDSFGKALGIGTQPFFEALKDTMKRLGDYMTVMNRETGEMELNPEFMKNMHTLSDILIGILKVVEFAARVLNDLVFPIIRKLVDAAKWLIDIVKSTPDPMGLGAVYDNPTLPNMPVDEMKKAAQEYLEMLKEARYMYEEGWKETESQFDKGVAYHNILEFKEKLEILRERLAEAGEDTSELKSALERLNDTSGETAHRSSSAAGAVNDFSYRANQATVSVEELQKRLKGLIGQFKEVESLSAKSGDQIAKRLLESKEKLAAVAADDSGSAQIEIAHKRVLELLEQERELMKKTGFSPGEIEAYLVGKRATEMEAYSNYLKAHEIEMARRDEKKSGGGKSPASGDINRQVDRFESRVEDMMRDLNNATYDFWIEQARNSGDFYRAEELSMEKWVGNSIDGIEKQKEQAVASLRELQQRVEKAGAGATPEALAQARKAAEEIAKIQEIAEAQKELVYKRAAEKQKQALIEKETERALALAQLKFEYAGVTGTLEDQLRLQALLISAEKEKNLQAAKARGATEEELELIRKIAAEQAKILEMRANGSFLQGFLHAAEESMKNLPTVFDVGAQAFNRLEGAIEGAADALAEFTMTGKMDFTDFANSVIKDLIRMMYQALLMKAVSSIFNLVFPSFGGGSGGNVEGAAGWLGEGVKLGWANGGVATFLTSPVGLASGGVVSRKTLAWVGEGSHKEAVVPLPDGRHIPAIVTGQGQPELNVHINVENQTGAPVKAKQSAARMDGKKYVIGVILEDYQNGGDIWKMIRGRN